MIKVIILLISIASQYQLCASQIPLSTADNLGAALHPQGRFGYALGNPNMKCIWKVYVKTGTKNNAGTDAVVTLKIYGKSGDNITVSNLEQYGKRPKIWAASSTIPFTYAEVDDPRYDFFENGRLDEFNFRDRCIKRNICKVELSHNNGGKKPGWYVDYIIVQDGPDSDYSKPHRFNFNRWIDTSDGLSATIDLCEN